MPSEAAVNRSYIAFISYRHLPLDRESAVRIQKQIERFIVPKEYRDRSGGAKNLGICFRDEDELPASASLSQSITQALDRSQYLIVICTPDLPQSRWCMEEIRYFMRTHGRDRVLAVLADGTPEQSFPDQLRFIRDDQGNIIKETEPLAANIAGPDHKINTNVLKKECVRICAAMLGCPFDALWQREQRARVSRMAVAALIVFAAMAVFIGVVLNKNSQITKQNLELEKEKSSALVDAGIAKLKEHNQNEAVQDALDALVSSNPSVYDHRAEKLLADALSVYSCGDKVCHQCLQLTTDIGRISASGDGKIAFAADQVGNIYAVDINEKVLLWNTHVRAGEVPFLYPVGNDRVLCKSPEALTALSAADGSVLWTYENYLPNSFQVISDDGSLFALLDWDVEPEDAYDAYVTRRSAEQSANSPFVCDLRLYCLDSATGEPRISFSLPGDDYWFITNTSAPVYVYGGDFSDDNKALAFALPSAFQMPGNGRRNYQLLMADLSDPDGILTVDNSIRIGTDLGVSYIVPDTILDVSVASDKSSVYWAMTSGNSLYSMVSYIDPAQKRALNTLEYAPNFDYGLPSGDSYGNMQYFSPLLIGSSLDNGQYIHPLHNNQVIILCRQNTVWLIDRSNGSLLYKMILESHVRDAVWLDQEEGLFSVITQNGYTAKYHASNDTEKVIELVETDTMPVNSISKVFQVYKSTEENNGSCLLAVTSDQPNNLVKIFEFRDSEYHSCSVDHTGECLFAEATPSGDRLLLFYPIDNESKKFLARTIDIRTGDLCEQATITLGSTTIKSELAGRTFESYPFQSKFEKPVLTDDSHFWMDGMLYGLDGSTTDTPSASFLYEKKAAVLEDGRLLDVRWADCNLTIIDDPSASDDDSQMHSKVLFWWIDGKSQEEKKDVDSCISMEVNEYEDQLSHFAVGKNGWMACWGYLLLPVEETGTGNTLFAQEKYERSEHINVAAENALSGEKVEFSNLSGETPVKKMILSNKEPYMTCVYETGDVKFFDLEKRICYGLSQIYSPSEISDLCFSGNDNYLLILTVNGRVDCYRTDTLEKAVSLPHGFTSDNNGPNVLVQAIEDADSERLILTAAEERTEKNNISSLYPYDRSKYWTTVLDTASWVPAAQTKDVCCWSVKHGQMFFVKDLELGTCRIRSLKELIELSRN
ncbi:MAG: TIR domain-containing protein [Lachnospiraceae bacterium]|nr:TIR domain-containing protein [Lachnospiraceae bacterium]